MKSLQFNQNVWSGKKVSFKYLLPLIMLLFSVNGANAQQLIGQYRTVDGGFEGQATGALTTVVTSTTWRVNDPTLTGTVIETGGRSGNKFVSLSLNNTITDYRHLQSANMITLPAGNHTVQFYYKGDKNADGTFGDIRGGIRGSALLAASAHLKVNKSDWTLYTATLNIGATTNGIVTVQIDEEIGKIAEFDIDDVVIYSGTADVTAPNSPGTVTVGNPTSSSLDVSWGAAIGGIDGGGYVVVRYAASPNADNDPNQKGIYAVGNTISNGTGSLTGTVRYIGTGTSFTDNVGLSPSTNYFYKVYTADKAFNYSVAATASGATNTVSGLNDLKNSYSMHVFVNANKQIAVSLNDELKGVVNIYNAIGQMISSNATTGSKTVTDKPFSSGVYFVSLIVEGNKITNKVIVK